MTDTIKMAATAAFCVLFSSASAMAQDVLLRITGDVEGGPYEFTDADLQAFTQNSFSTETIWTDGSNVYSGPTLAGILEAVGAGDGDIRLGALNDYFVDVSRDAIEQDVPIVANRIDGEPFGVRAKGPLWVVFPYDSNMAYRAEDIYAYSVWQLTSIEVLD